MNAWNACWVVRGTGRGVWSSTGWECFLKRDFGFPFQAPWCPAKLQHWAVTDGGGGAVAAYDRFNLYLFSGFSKVALLVPAQVQYHLVTTLHQETHTPTHRHTKPHMHTQQQAHSYMHTLISADTCTDTDMHAQAHADACTATHTQTCTQTDVQIHMHTQTCTDTCTHMQTVT